MNTSCRIGVDIGGTKVNAGVLRPDGSILKKCLLSSGGAGNPRAFVKEICSSLCGMLDELGIPLSLVEHIGVGIPGTADSARGVVEYSCNLFGRNVPLGDYFEHVLGRRVVLVQDSWAAAFAEHLFGASRGHDDMMCVTIGTGIGCGVVLGGRVFGGAMHIAGELGHTPIVWQGRPCSCGRKGCLEAYTSGNAIWAQAVERFPEKLRELPQRAETIFDLVYAGDADARQLVEECVDKLAYGIALGMNLLSVDTVILSGGVSVHRDLIINPLKEKILRYGYPAWTETRSIHIRPAELGADAPMVGARSLPSIKLAFQIAKGRCTMLLFTEPVPRPALWGGTLLRDYFHYSQFPDGIGQSWSFSAQEGEGLSNRVAGMEGMTLLQLWQTRPELFRSRHKRFPIIISLVAPEDDLSLQIHPNAQQSARLGYPTGKNEAWYFLDTQSNARIVYGQNARNEAQLREMIAAERWDEIMQHLPVQKGDFVYLPAGLVHALKKGSIVYEIQQATEITYRFFDYHRVDSQGRERPLQLEEAIGCVDYTLTQSGAKCPGVTRTLPHAS